MLCVICHNEAVYNDLCKPCWLGLKCFNRNTKLLGRAISYLGPKRAKLLTKHQRRNLRQRNAELRRLIAEQKIDMRDHH